MSIKRLISGCAVIMLFFSCAKNPSRYSTQETATLNISAKLISYDAIAKSAKSMQTTYDSLIVKISSSDMPTHRFAFSIENNSKIISKTITEIKAGANRMIEVWTVDKTGDIIHGISSKILSFAPNQKVSAEFILNPICGSIYISIYDFPAAVDSVVAIFIIKEPAQKTLSRAEKKSTRNFLTLDKIPYGSKGTLIVAGITANGDTIASWRKDNFEFRKENITLEASFVNVGQLLLNVTITKPGVTLINGRMSFVDSLEDEKGSLVITEIMYYGASDSDYIEIYNYSDSAFRDSLIIDHEGILRKLGIVTIAAKSFFIVANKKPSWSYDSLKLAIAPLELVSTGNFICLKSSEGKVMDYVFYASSSTEGNEWPAKSSAKAIELRSIHPNPEHNNYGANWKLAEALIEGSSTHYGSPGK